MTDGGGGVNRYAISLEPRGGLIHTGLSLSDESDRVDGRDPEHAVHRLVCRFPGLYEPGDRFACAGRTFVAVRCGRTGALGAKEECSDT